MSSNKDGTIDAATSDFTKIVGKPTAVDIARLEKEAIEFAGAMENSKSNRFGQAGMLMEPEAFQTFVGKAGYQADAWMEPKAPGNYPRFRPGEDKDVFRIKTELWHIENGINKDFVADKKKLKQQFLNAVEGKYLREIRDANDTTMGVGPKEILEYLKMTYGQITAREVEANRKKLYEPWDGRNPIAELWERMRNVRDLATFANAPISDIDSISAVLTIMDGIIDFADAVKAQRMKALAEWSWDDTVVSFTKVDNARDHTTTATSGYHTANNTTTINTVQSNEAGSANATSGTPPKYDNTRGNGIKLNKHEFIFAYCHSCGYSKNRRHNSETCEWPKEGHKKEANMYNTLDGNQAMNLGKRKREKETVAQGTPAKR